MKRGRWRGGFSGGVPLFVASMLGLAITAGGQTTARSESPTGDPPRLGSSLAPGMMTLLQQEMTAGLKTRRIESNFSRFRSYAGYKLDSTDRPRTGSEVTNICRLDWYDHLLRNPMKAPIEAEKFTRELHQSLKGNHEGLEAALCIARTKMDCPPRQPREFAPVASPEEALEAVKRALTVAQMSHGKALSPLTRSEVQELSKNLYPVLTSQNRVGHTLSRISTGRRLCGLLEKLDRDAIHAAAEGLVPLSDPGLLDQLGSLTAEGNVTVGGVTGTISRYVVTPSGSIVVGGPGRNTYDLDKMAQVSAVIDLGGDDAYREGTVSLARPVLVVIDLEGNDAYQGAKPGIQGSAVMGISMLLDRAGNDVYQAQDVAQGSCLAGVGILIDRAGNDSYVGVRRVQGQAVAGVGLLVDHAGHDRYRAALWAQGLGGPLGFAVLEDADGKDHYYGGGRYINSYKDDDETPTPGYEGWSQGMGGGLRAVSNGGIGVILDGGGDDVYEFDYLSHGGGYWLGIGFARDFGGNDRRLGATLKAYHGGSRTETRYQRFGTGFGCHYALGFCFDDEGDDTYHGTIMGLGFAWDCSVGGLFDFGGNDVYEASGSTTKGVGAQAGLGILYDYNGDDAYKGRGGQGYASSGISYHDLPRCGGNFSFVVDYGGEDEYGCRAKNDSYNRRSSSGGFLIDRPRRESDEEETAERPSEEATVGSVTQAEGKVQSLIDSGRFDDASYGKDSAFDRTVRVPRPPVRSSFSGRGGRTRRGR
ncbi:hypothetical protein ACFL5Q_05795 [Planctomycetota bacterium]